MEFPQGGSVINGLPSPVWNLRQIKLEITKFIWFYYIVQNTPSQPGYNYIVCCLYSLSVCKHKSIVNLFVMSVIVIQGRTFPKDRLHLGSTKGVTLFIFETGRQHKEHIWNTKITLCITWPDNKGILTSYNHILTIYKWTSKQFLLPIWCPKSYPPNR